MLSANNGFLGQLLPAPSSEGIPLTIARTIKQMFLQSDFQGRQVHVLVTSKNALKVQAAQNSVLAWIQALFSQAIHLVAKGYGAQSNIDEQPHGLDHTRLGALNRLKNLKIELASIEKVNEQTQDGVLRILISLENGLMREVINPLKNADIFKNTDGTVWVDRCVEVGEVWYQGQVVTFGAVSEGVTTPKSAVEASEHSNWSETAGSFISKHYGWNAADWHGSIAGKGRQAIMELLAQSALGLQTYSIPAPQKIRQFDPDRDCINYHQYDQEEVAFFSPRDINHLLDKEIQHRKKIISSEEMQEVAFWREYYQNQIPKPSKFGPNGKVLMAADGVTALLKEDIEGVILTEDVMVGYFDQDVLHVVLLWANKSGEEPGWVLPGKKDRAYDKIKGDISVRDADYSLIKKEIDVDPEGIAYHFILGYFDDRKREQRMKTSGWISFVLLNEKPTLEPGKRIGVPLNLLVQLAQREIVLPPTSSSPISDAKGMARNHDSLILSIIDTAKFYNTMEKIKHAQIQWKQLLLTNPKANRPVLSELDPGTECQVCSSLLVGVKVICFNGHILCGICLPRIQQANNCCPECRENIPKNPVSLPQIESMIKSQNPKLYAERFQEMQALNIGGQPPITWRNDDTTFKGDHITYAS